MRKRKETKGREKKKYRWINEEVIDGRGKSTTKSDSGRKID